MAIKTTLEQIEELDEAITATLAALKTAGPGGDAVERNRYESLVKERSRLLSQHLKETGSGGPTFNVPYVRGY